MRKIIVQAARDLRNNSTEAERYLWFVLSSKNLGFKFRRQAVIDRYIVDFVCYERKLVIEVDGSQHANSESDKVRDRWLREQGFEVLRFWNHEVLRNRDGVIQEIIKYLPLPGPPHKGEGN